MLCGHRKALAVLCSQRGEAWSRDRGGRRSVLGFGAGPGSGSSREPAVSSVLFRGELPFKTFQTLTALSWLQGADRPVRCVCAC